MYINWKLKVFYVVKVINDLMKFFGFVYGYIILEGRMVLNMDFFLNIILENVKILIFNLKLDFYLIYSL